MERCLVRKRFVENEIFEWRQILNYRQKNRLSIKKYYIALSQTISRVNIVRWAFYLFDHYNEFFEHWSVSVFKTDVSRISEDHFKAPPAINIRTNWIIATKNYYFSKHQLLIYDQHSAYQQRFHNSPDRRDSLPLTISSILYVQYERPNRLSATTKPHELCDICVRLTATRKSPMIPTSCIQFARAIVDHSIDHEHAVYQDYEVRKQANKSPLAHLKVRKNLKLWYITAPRAYSAKANKQQQIRKLRNEKFLMTVNRKHSRLWAQNYRKPYS